MVEWPRILISWTQTAQPHGLQRPAQHAQRTRNEQPNRSTKTLAHCVNRPVVMPATGTQIAIQQYSLIVNSCILQVLVSAVGLVRDSRSVVPDQVAGFVVHPGPVGAS